MQLLNHPYIYIPAKDGHDECHCWEHVTHGTREGGGCELQSGIVEVLINHWPVNQVNNQYVIFYLQEIDQAYPLVWGIVKYAYPRRPSTKSCMKTGNVILGLIFLQNHISKSN